jgi:hypothetical protein
MADKAKDITIKPVADKKSLLLIRKVFIQKLKLK